MLGDEGPDELRVVVNEPQRHAAATNLMLEIGNGQQGVGVFVEGRLKKRLREGPVEERVLGRQTIKSIGHDSLPPQIGVRHARSKDHPRLRVRRHNVPRGKPR